MGSWSVRRVVVCPGACGCEPKPLHLFFLLHELRCQIQTLQEEVLHLRQFSMALIRERGELAHSMQVPELKPKD